MEEKGICAGEEWKKGWMYLRAALWSLDPVPTAK